VYNEHIKIETELETDGRWIAEAIELPGVLAYGKTEQEAIRSVEALAHMIAGRENFEDFSRADTDRSC
jgi:predicted RNase H-like HicB family nuclease